MGQKRREEPSSTEELRKDQRVLEIFATAQWLPFFDKFQGHELWLVRQFAAELNENSVTLRGHTIPVSLAVISSISGIPAEGEELTLGKESPDDVLDAFHHLAEPRANKVTSKGRDRGINRVSLAEPWSEVATWMLKYFFCEGQYATL